MGFLESFLLLFSRCHFSLNKPQFWMFLDFRICIYRPREAGGARTWYLMYLSYLCLSSPYNIFNLTKQALHLVFLFCHDVLPRKNLAVMFAKCSSYHGCHRTIWTVGSQRSNTTSTRSVLILVRDSSHFSPKFTEIVQEINGDAYD